MTDLDGDGLLDLLVGNYSGSVVRFEQAVPTISSFSPPSGAVGSTLTINGTNLSNATSMRFGELLARPSTISVNAAGTQLTVPVLVATNTVSVTTPGVGWP